MTFISLRSRVGSVLSLAASLSLAGLSGCGRTLIVGDAGSDDAPAEEPEAEVLTWARTYGGPGEDLPRALVEAPDGRFIVAGFTSSHGAGNDDGWLLEVDSSGDVLAERTLGGESDDWLEDVLVTEDGGLVVAGGVRFVPWIARLDPDGGIAWQEWFDGGSTDSMALSCIRPTAAGGFVATEVWDVSFWLVVLGSDGTVELQRRYQTSEWEYPACVTEHPSGDFVMVGHLSYVWEMFGDALVLRVDPGGEPVWARSLGGDHDELFTQVSTAADGSVVAAGYSGSFGADHFGFWAAAFDDDGAVLWQRSYLTGSWDELSVLAPASDGGWILAGRTSTWNGDDWVGGATAIRIDASGVPIWQRLYAEDTQVSDVEDIIETTDGGLLMALTTPVFGAGERDVLLVKTDAEGRLGGDCPDGFVIDIESVSTETHVVPVDVHRSSRETDAEHDSQDWVFSASHATVETVCE